MGLDRIDIRPAPAWLLDKLRPSQARGLMRQSHADDRSVTFHAGAASEDRTANADAMLGGCAWFQHTLTDAAELSEAEWYAMLSLLARCENGEQLAHEFSKAHPGYSKSETDAKFQHALQAAGPRTCQNIAQISGESYCAQCPHSGKITSPIILGRQEHLVNANNALEKFGLRLDGRRYYIGDEGIYHVRLRDGAYKPDWSRPVATRPIFPSALGIDLASGLSWVELSWLNSKGTVTRRWLLDSATNDRTALLALDDAPTSLGRLNALSDWLADSKAYVAAPPRDITSRVGWIGSGQDRRFILPNDAQVEYIGPTLGSSGTLEGWASALVSIIQSGRAGYTALSVIGLSAAAPFVRLLGKRNPVIGLVAESSQGKGTVVNYALAIWGAPADLTVPAGSTVKGVQDRGINSRDLPLFLDELQQLLKTDPRKVEDAIYFLGNGQRRVTSSKAQAAVGGERRYGVGFYAAEEPITHALQLGAQYRVIELDGPPMIDEAQAIAVQQATNANYGVVGLLLAARANEDRDSAPMAIKVAADQIKAQHPGIKGEDAYTIALVEMGLEALMGVTGLELPADDVASWLAEMVDGSRATTVDRQTAAWRALVETLQGLAPGLSVTTFDDLTLDGGIIVQGGHHVAWRGRAAELATGGLDINPRAPMVEAILKPYGGGDACSRIWAARGWIERKGDELKVRRRQGDKILRVWRVTAQGMQAAGFDPAHPARTRNGETLMRTAS